MRRAGYVVVQAAPGVFASSTEARIGGAISQAVSCAQAASIRLHGGPYLPAASALEYVYMTHSVRFLNGGAYLRPQF